MSTFDGWIVNEVSGERDTWGSWSQSLSETWTYPGSGSGSGSGYSYSTSSATSGTWTGPHQSYSGTVSHPGFYDQAFNNFQGWPNYFGGTGGTPGVFDGRGFPATDGTE